MSELARLLLSLPHSAVARAVGGLLLTVGILAVLAWRMKRSHRPVWAGFFLAGALGVLFLGVESASPKNALFGPFVSHGSQAGGLVALTFDDGPDPAYTPQVLAILAKYNVRATFFMLGSQAARHPELAREVQAQGEVIGSHCYDHVSLLTASRHYVRSEISRAETELEKVLGEKPHFLRPPYGFHPPFLMEEAKKRDYLVVGWSLSSHDSSRLSAEQLARRVIDQARPGDIILLHDGRGNRQATVAALPEILEGLKAKGLQCVTFPELLDEPSPSLRP
jgi:peptidoglycan-N-acetylglucosamine deacetylase